MRKKRKGTQIIMNSEVSKRIFPSKHEASRFLGISENRITRLINSGRALVINEREYWLDELFEEERFGYIDKI